MIPTEAFKLVEALFGFGKETRPNLGVAKLVSQQYILVITLCVAAMFKKP